MPCLPALALSCLAVLPAQAAPPARPTFDWAPWRDTGLTTSYYNVLPRHDGQIELWFGATFRGTDAVIGLAGPSLGELPRTAPRFDATLVSGYDRHRPKRATPILSRTSAARLADGSYVVQTNVGPEYEGGATELYPLLFVSPTGAAGTWKQLGPPAGEPAAWLEQARKANQKIRCEGGSLVQLPDGTLRLYLRGFGVRLAVMEAPRVEGPWTFRKDRAGRPLDLLAGLPGGDWLFPLVMPIGAHGYLLTGADTWPPKAVWAAYSTDGLTFRVPALAGQPQPLIRPADIVPGATSLKCLRGAFDPATGQFEAVANVWDDQAKTYRLYHSVSRFPLGVFGVAASQPTTRPAR